ISGTAAGSGTVGRSRLLAGLAFDGAVVEAGRGGGVAGQGRHDGRAVAGLDVVDGAVAPVDGGGGGDRVRAGVPVVAGQRHRRSRDGGYLAGLGAFLGEAALAVRYHEVAVDGRRDPAARPTGTPARAARRPAPTRLLGARGPGRGRGTGRRVAAERHPARH